MNKVFEILNTQPNITKTKVFTIDLIFKTSVIKKNIDVKINCFDNKQVKQLSVLNNKRTKETRLSISSMPKYQENIIIFETDIYGFDINNLDIKYDGFIKDNIMLILDNINKLFFNFNLKYGSEIKPTVFSIFRILDSLKIIKADKIEIFYDTELEEFYPEVFEIECVSR